jgi:hypothetical protein
MHRVSIAVSGLPGNGPAVAKMKSDNSIEIHDCWCSLVTRDLKTLKEKPDKPAFQLLYVYLFFFTDRFKTAIT